MLSLQPNFFIVFEFCLYTFSIHFLRSDLMVKKLRYYARFIVVCLLLNKVDLVKELIHELRHYLEEYVSVYEADDDEEWRLVISEVTAFMEVMALSRKSLGSN